MANAESGGLGRCGRWDFQVGKESSELPLEEPGGEGDSMALSGEPYGSRAQGERCAYFRGWDQGPE